MQSFFPALHIRKLAKLLHHAPCLALLSHLVMFKFHRWLVFSLIFTMQIFCSFAVSQKIRNHSVFLRQARESGGEDLEVVLGEVAFAVVSS